jgi:hypothetical protein
MRRFGERYILDGQEYILALAGSNLAVLINVISGNRWAPEPTKLKKMGQISKTEWCHLRDGDEAKLIRRKK